jgi:DNA-binding transcriptional LysR family regulator
MEALTLRRLRYLSALAREGHFTRAAERLHISQPALTVEIRRLEEELGLQLFIRSRTGTRPTEAGARLVMRAESLLESADRLVEEARDIATGAVGHVRIGFVQTMVHRPLPATVRSLADTHPGIRVELVELGTGAQLEALHRGHIDIACGHAPSPDPADDSRLLLTEEFHACLPVGHGAPAGRVPLAALADEDFIVFGHDVSPHYFDRLVAMCLTAGFQPRIVHRTSTWHTVAQLVAAGLGVALVPSGTTPMTGKVRLVPLEEPGLASDVWLVTRGGVSDPAVDTVRRALVETIGT